MNHLRLLSILSNTDQTNKSLKTIKSRDLKSLQSVTDESEDENDVTMDEKDQLEIYNSVYHGTSESKIHEPESFVVSKEYRII
jgi:hypothetical protein